MLRDAHAPVDDARAAGPPQPRHLADRVGVHAADLRGALGRVLLHDLRQLAVVRHALGDELAIDPVVRDHLVQDPVVEGHVRAGLQLAVDVGVVGDPLAPRVDHDQGRAAPPGLLEEARRDRVVRRRVRAGEDRHVGVHDVAVGGRHRARAHALEQRGHARGVAQPRAVVDVVGAEARADQLLEEVGLLVRALGRAESGDGAGAALGVDPGEPLGGERQRLLPARLAEVGEDLVVVNEPAGLVPAAAPLALDVAGQRALRVGVLAADQGRGQALRRAGVVPAVAALHAQAPLRARLLAPVGERDRVALAVDVIGERAADAAIWADGLDAVELRARPDRDGVDRLVRQRAGRAGSNALAAGHAGRLAHRIVQVERDQGRVALAGAADHVVALDVVAGADAAVAQDAGVVVDRDDRVAQIDAAAAAEWDPVLALDPVAAGEHEQLVVGRGRLLGVLGRRRLVHHQELGERGAPGLDLRGRRLHLHAVLAGTNAGGRVDAGAHVHHAHPADADGVVAVVVAEHRNVDPGALRGVVDRGALRHRELLTVDAQRDGSGCPRGGDRHVVSLAGWAELGQIGLSRAHRVFPAWERRVRRVRARRSRRRSCPAGAPA